MRARTLAAAVLLVGAGSVPVAMAATASSGPPQVAVVKAVHGHLVLKHGGRTSALAVGDAVRFGDTVVAGKGVTATVTVTVPKGHSADEQLFTFANAGGAHHTVGLVRGKTSVTMTIG